MNINTDLITLAEWRLKQLNRPTETPAEKTAFVPPGGDAAGGGGAPPGVADPSAGGMPPPDPSMGGAGAPPPDPSAGGGAPVPGGGGMTADTISQIVAQTMQQMNGMGGGAGGAGAGAGKMAKPDINTVAIDIFQVKKMLQYMFNTMGIPLPPDILDGPNRDPSTGTPMPPGASGSTSDPSMVSQQPAGGGAGAGGQQGGAIPPIQPMQPGGPGVAGPSPGGAPPGMGAEKQGEDSVLHMGNGYSPYSFDPRHISRAAALSALVKRLQGE